MIRKNIIWASAAVSLSIIAQASANEPIWRAAGFKNPESVEYDAKRNQYYVSNVNDGVAEQDGNGSIGLIDGDGKVVAVEWVTGLHSPKGLALDGHKLYVADVKELTVIDVDKKVVIARYEAPQSGVLNGITIAPNGKIFVSDWFGNRIYTLEDGALSVWLESPALASPNGLVADQSTLYVASWGKNPKPDFTTETSGGVQKISLKTKKIKALDHNGRWINMDGFVPYSSKKWLISDFLKGEVLTVTHNGAAETAIKLRPGSADIFYRRDDKILIAPFFMDGHVEAYALK